MKLTDKQLIDKDNFITHKSCVICAIFCKQNFSIIPIFANVLWNAMQRRKLKCTKHQRLKSFWMTQYQAVICSWKAVAVFFGNNSIKLWTTRKLLEHKFIFSMAFNGVLVPFKLKLIKGFKCKQKQSPRTFSIFFYFLRFGVSIHLSTADQVGRQS